MLCLHGDVTKLTSRLYCLGDKNKLETLVWLNKMRATCVKLHNIALL